MSAREMDRLNRSFAAVESGYVRDLLRREPGGSRAGRPGAGSEHGRSGRERVGAAHGRVRTGKPTHARRAMRG
jgi:hypothetical protein